MVTKSIKYVYIWLLAVLLLLAILVCKGNQRMCLNVKNGYDSSKTHSSSFGATNKPALTCI